MTTGGRRSIADWPRVLYIESDFHNPSHPMITSKAVTLYGFFSITVMLVLLLLIWFRLVPETYYWPFVAIAALLFVSRIILRIKAAKNERGGSGSGGGQTP